ncbi:hypothetical protein [Neisseria sp.]|uniref:hypothetical protein n=1 Tax=Neisseria sp. TaxID=192066 RepID=UPI00359F84B6
MQQTSNPVNTAIPATAYRNISPTMAKCKLHLFLCLCRPPQSAFPKTPPPGCTTIGALRKRLPNAVIRPSVSSSKDSLKFVLDEPIPAENGTILTQYTITFKIEKNRRKFYLSYDPEYRNQKGIIVERAINSALYEYVGARCTKPSGEFF